jgi:preprotein translocase subunit SecD
VAIIIDGEVKAAPMVRGAIPTGRAHVSLGRGAQLSEARTLAAAIKGGVLPSDVVLESEGPYAPRSW